MNLYASDYSLYSVDERGTAYDFWKKDGDTGSCFGIKYSNHHAKPISLNFFRETLQDWYRFRLEFKVGDMVSDGYNRGVPIVSIHKDSDGVLYNAFAVLLSDGKIRCHNMWSSGCCFFKGLTLDEPTPIPILKRADRFLAGFVDSTVFYSKNIFVNWETYQ
jgi:hypothetical protein